jgi:hypothetical protein
MPTRNAKPRPPRNSEARLEKAVRRFTGKGPESCRPLEWTNLLESFRLTILYGGQFVIFRDHFRKEGKDLWLVRREVLCHSRNMVKVQKFLAALPDREKREVGFGYIEPPDAPLRA